MDLARVSFEKKQNPFAKIISTEVKKEVKEDTTTEEIGFAQKRVKDLQNQIVNRNRTANKELSDIEVERAMMNASMDYKKSSSFIGALEFLNSQATIALIKKKGNAFNAIA